MTKASHTVVQPSQVGLAGASDARHLEHAIRAGLVLLSKDSSDFENLHQLVLTAGGGHPGILLVRFDNDPTRDMRPKHMVSAVGKLERAGIDLRSQVFILNHWR